MNHLSSSPYQSLTAPQTAQFWAPPFQTPLNNVAVLPSHPTTTPPAPNPQLKPPPQHFCSAGGWWIVACSGYKVAIPSRVTNLFWKGMIKDARLLLPSEG